MSEYNKDFYECYAKLCLCGVLSEGYGDLCHAEAPDLQGRQLSIGIEVTRSVSAEEARDHIVVNDVNEQIAQLEYSISRKLERLNNIYKLFKSNRLYIFAETKLLNSQNIKAAIQNVYRKCEDLPVKYDVIYVDCIDCLYFVQEKNYIIKKANISVSEQKAMEKKALKLRNKEF